MKFRQNAVRQIWQALGLFTVIASGLPARAEIQLPETLQSPLVLQQNQPMILTGTAGPGEEILAGLVRPAESPVPPELIGTQVTPEQAAQLARQFHSAQRSEKVLQRVRTRADKDGHFEVRLKPISARDGGTYRLIFQGINIVVVDDVRVGEVWVCERTDSTASFADIARAFAAALKKRLGVPVGLVFREADNLYAEPIPARGLLLPLPNSDSVHRLSDLARVWKRPILTLLIGSQTDEQRRALAATLPKNVFLADALADVPPAIAGEQLAQQAQRVVYGEK